LANQLKQQIPRRLKSARDDKNCYGAAKAAPLQNAYFEFIRQIQNAQVESFREQRRG
jgi:hypothetical protein